MNDTMLACVIAAAMATPTSGTPGARISGPIRIRHGTVCAAPLVGSSGGGCATSRRGTTGGNHTDGTSGATATVTIAPGSASLPIGAALALTAVVRTSSGTPVSSAAIEWRSSALAIARVSATGVVVAVSAGSATITAASGGKSQAAVVTVTPSPSVPGARGDAVGAFDEARQRVLMYGGGGAGGVTYDELWSWNDTTWTLLAANGPGARVGAVGAYDAQRQRFVIHGGTQSGATRDLTDTWEWDGTRWQEVQATGPPPRRHAKAGYDKARARVVLYGGYLPNSFTPFTDTWEWDGQAWVQRVATSPSALDMPMQLVFSPGQNALLLLVGSSRSPRQTQLLTWSGSSWSSLGSGPPSLAPSPMVATTDSELLLLDTFPTGASTADTWRFDGQAWTRLNVTGPAARYGPVMVYDAARARTVLFGGSGPTGEPTFADTWTWNGTAWTKVVGP